MFCDSCSAETVTGSLFALPFAESLHFRVCEEFIDSIQFESESFIVEHGVYCAVTGLTERGSPMHHFRFCEDATF